MPHVLHRLTASALVATSLLAATAFADPEPMPASMEPILKGMHIEKYSSLMLQDEKGAPIAPDAFAAAVFKSGKALTVRKETRAGVDPIVMLRLVDKDAKPAALPPPKLKAGDAFPAFHLARLDGQTVDNKALAGRYTLVSFYFANCAPCIKEIPELNALAEIRKDFNVLAVTFDTQAESQQFVDKHHLNWPVLPDARPLIDAVGIKSYPTLALVDPAGKVVEIAHGNLIERKGGIGDWLDKLAVPAR